MIPEAAAVRDKPHWSVCLICGLAGPVSAPGVSYCRVHGEQHDPEPPEEWTLIEHILGRRVSQTNSTVEPRK